jgi:hypothetical protein
MPCACAKCLEHSRTLGLASGLNSGPASKAAIRKAYRAAARTWHPDRHENHPRERMEAEEKFKSIQAAYTELLDHCENPVTPLFIENAGGAYSAVDPFAPTRRVDDAPAISFGGAPGCFTTSDFSPQALEIVWKHIREPDRALALVDLSRHGSPLGDLSQYILFSQHGIVVRDAQQIVSLLWYDDLGETRFVDRRKNGKLGLWQRWVENMAGAEHKYALEIRRQDGTLFFAIADQTDDSVKKVIYNFLQQKRPLPNL